MPIIIFRRPLALAACAMLLAAAAQAQTVLYEDNEEAGTVNTVSSNGTLTHYKTIGDTADLKGIAFDSNNNLFVVNKADSTISKITSAGVVSIFATVPDTELRFMTTGAGNNLFVSASTILKVTPAGVVSTYATLPGNAIPEGLAFDANGNLFVASQTSDTNVAVVYKVTTAGAVNSFANLPDKSFPNGLVIDASGNLYVAETQGGKIDKITPTGAISTFATLASEEGPVSLAMDTSGNLFTTLAEDARIQKISSTGVESSFASDQNVPGDIVFGPAAVPAPTITSAATATAQVGKAFSYQITASHDPTSYGVLGLRSHLSVDSKTGKITGTPTGSGTFTLTLKAANASGTGTEALKLTIKPSTPIITSQGTATATVGQPFSYQIKATSSPTSYGVGGLFKGVTVNQQTGLISSTSTAAGTHPLDLRATNAGGTGHKTLTLTIAK